MLAVSLRIQFKKECRCPEVTAHFVVVKFSPDGAAGIVQLLFQARRRNGFVALHKKLAPLIGQRVQFVHSGELQSSLTFTFPAIALLDLFGCGLVVSGHRREGFIGNAFAQNR